MNKKLLISLASLSTIAIVTPILATVSCASDTPVKATNLTITAINTPKLTKSDVEALKGTDLKAQWDALAKLFEGPDFTPANQNNFKVSINETEAIVTLTANTGFTISDKTTLVSNKYTVQEQEIVDLKITAITPSVTLTAIEAFNLTISDPKLKLESLSKIFTGITESNLSNFKVSFDSSQNIATLEALSGFTINGQQTLASNSITIQNVILNITKKTGTLNIMQADLDVLTATTPDAAAQLTALNKLFTGIDATNQNYFTITVDTKAKTVTLNGLNGFSFGTSTSGSKTLVSDVYTIVTQ
ncbi:MAG: hypothetical protein ACRCRP_00530 [Metamycoplasmataceae bacterium]